MMSASRLPQYGRTPLYVAHLVLLLITVPVLSQSQSVTFTTNTSISSTTTRYENYNIEVSGCTLTVDGKHKFASLTVDANSVVTHTAGSTSGMNLAIAGDLTVASGGQITADGCGYASGAGIGHGTNGQTNYARSGGGAYGGNGGTDDVQGGVGYGSIVKPSQAGSGGGGNTPSIGGSGGGVIILNVGGALTLASGSRISANGSSVQGYGHGGGGAGGSIWVSTGTLAGSGSITVLGGIGYYGGCGAGGRIAIYYGDMSQYAGGWSAAGGYNNGNDGTGGAGTIYLQQASAACGDLILDNQGGAAYPAWTPIGGLTALNSLTVANGAVMQCTPKFSLNVSSDVIVLGIAGSVSTSGIVGQSMSLNIGGNLYIDSGNINVDAGGNGSGAGTGGGKNGPPGGGGGGGAYGGNGGANSGGLAFGQITQPTALGSGGGSGNGGTNIGGAGGGAIHLTVGGVLLLGYHGLIAASGGNGTGTNSGSGAGSGGSIWINAAVLAGEGEIAANGGSAAGGGGGGGGRIAVYYTDSTDFAGDIIAVGGVGTRSYNGGAGTIYTQQTGEVSGDLLIDNQGAGGAATPLIGVTNLNTLTILSSGTVVTRPPGGILSLTTAGDLYIGDGATLSVDGLGYAPGAGAGAGGNSSLDSGGGAGHGGAGGAADNASGGAGGATYDNPQAPVKPGSGGGAGLTSQYPGQYPGGSGGGAIRLVVNGALTLDGSASIHANAATTSQGTTPGANGGGGAGGSIWITTVALAGSGTISANGASLVGAAGNGGGGGGGLIAIYYTDNSQFLGSLNVLGGAGTNNGLAGADGGVYTQQTNSLYNLTGLFIAPTTVAGGVTATGTVTILTAAPAGGISVALQSSDPLTASVPASVTIKQGATSASFNIATSSVQSAIPVTIDASSAGATVSAQLTVAPWLSSLTLSPMSVSSNATVTGTITLSSPAPAGGLTVHLMTSKSYITIPAKVAIPAGQTSATFNFSVGTVTTSSTAAITAILGTQTLTTPLDVNIGSAQVASVSVIPTSVAGGLSATGIVTLTQAAPAGGAQVAIALSNPAVASAPATVLVAAGATTATFTILTQPVAAKTPVTVSASLSVTVSTTLTVRLPGVSSLTLSPASVTGGQSAVGVVTIETPSVVPVTITISSSASQATPQVSIVIPPGATSGSFVISTVAVTSQVSAQITAAANGLQSIATLTIQP